MWERMSVVEIFLSRPHHRVSRGQDRKSPFPLSRTARPTRRYSSDWVANASWFRRARSDKRKLDVPVPDQAVHGLARVPMTRLPRSSRVVESTRLRVPARSSTWNRRTPRERKASLSRNQFHIQPARPDSQTRETGRWPLATPAAAVRPASVTHVQSAAIRSPRSSGKEFFTLPEFSSDKC